MGNLASAVDELSVADVSAWADAALADAFVDVSRQVERLHAVRLTWLAALDERRIGADGHGGSTAAWLRAATGCTPSTAARDVRLARDLTELPVTRAALADGRLSVEHARVIAGLRRDVAADAVAAAEPHLVDAAAVIGPHELRGWAAHVRHAYAPELMIADEADAYAARELTAATTLYGTGVGSWTLPPVMHETVLTAIHAFSAPIAGDDRSPAQRRADALVTMAELALRSGAASGARGVKPHVSVLVPLDTLERRAGAPAASYGFGATSSGEWARRICCDASVARVVTGARSEPLDAGRATRCFSPAQVRAIVARDRHCRWPGCDAPPAWSEAHHIRHWADGGESNVANAVLLCGRHHDRVHAGAHRVIVRPDGTRGIDPTPGSAGRGASDPSRPRGGGGDPHGRPPATGPP